MRSIIFFCLNCIANFNQILSRLEDSTMIRRNLDLKTKKLSLGPNKANRLGPNRNFRM